MAEQWGQISSPELVTTSVLLLDLGNGEGMVKQSKNPLWIKNADNACLKGKVKQENKNVGIALFINGLLSSSEGSDVCWLIDIDENAGDIYFEYTGDKSLFENAFLFEVKLI